jgi:hypothetical protein
MIAASVMAAAMPVDGGGAAVVEFADMDLSLCGRFVPAILTHWAMLVARCQSFD